MHRNANHHHHHHYHHHSWTFTGLIGAFLDLSLAYILLCGSTLVFFASKFLSFFGLHLPCPCNNNNDSNPICLHTLFISSPLAKISSVQTSLRTKPPFDSLWVCDNRLSERRLSLKFIEESDRSHSRNGFVEFEGEASCSSLSDARAEPRRRSGGLRRRRRASAVVSPLDAREIAGDEADSGNRFEMEALDGVNLCEGTQSNGFHLEELVGEDLDEESNSSEEQLVDEEQQMIGGNKENVIRALEHALEEEYAARAALYVELEKERSAAATAADEAMAMILRLQKEKAVIEMEARQYQRMIEEKSAYDAEEMNILKEILVRREREKHFLEKEVEVYRRMMIPENEQVNGDLHGVDGIMGQMLHPSFDPSEDPVLMLQQISESIDKREMAKVTKESSEGHVFAFGKESSPPNWGEGRDYSNLGNISKTVSIEKHHLEKCESMDERKQESQEKGMLSTDGNPSGPEMRGLRSEVCSGVSNSNDLHGHDLLEKTVIFVDEEQGRKYNARVREGISVEADKSHDDVQIHFPCEGTSLEKHGKDADPGFNDWRNSVSEAEPSVLDVHVIDDKTKLSDEGSGKESEAFMVSDRHGKCGLQSEASCFRGVGIICDRPSTSRGETELDTHRSSSDMSSVTDKSLGKSLLFELRRNSMSAVENEKLKLENEVDWLRERLRIVQEGREKLSFSMEHREREKVQLQLLEDIARQLNEIRQLTEPGKAVRQVSLPPPPSKASSRKRRYRSASSGLPASS